MHTLFLHNDDLHKIVSTIGVNTVMRNCIKGLLDAYLYYDSTKIVMKKRDGFMYNKPHSGVLEWMPIMTDENIALIKIVGYNPQNPVVKKLPTILSQINLVDTTTGHTLALMDGRLMTAIRTGAASAVASKLMANPDSEILGIVGCGCQAVTQFHALSQEFNFKKIYLYDIDVDSAVSLSKYLERFDVVNEIVALEKLVEESDIICTVTSAEANFTPVIKSLCTKQHTHINAVGSDLPKKIEIPRELLMKSYVCPDYLEQAIAEGECQQLRPHEIGLDIISLSKSTQNFDNLKQTITVYDSTGIPLQDLVIAQQFIDYAKQLKMNNVLEKNIYSDQKNPYDGIDIRDFK